MDFYINYSFKYYKYFRIKGISILFITISVYSLFFIGLSIEKDVSNYYKENQYLAFSTPFVVFPKTVKELECNEFGLSLSSQIIKKEYLNEFQILKNDFSKNNFVFFNVFTSYGDIVDEGQIVIVYCMDLQNIKFFDGFYKSNILDKYNETDCIVTEQLSKDIGDYLLLGSITINENYNITKLKIVNKIKYKLNFIKNIYYPSIFISREMGQKLFGIDNIDNVPLFIYREKSIFSNKTKHIIKNIVKEYPDFKVFDASVFSKDTSLTFKYIDLFVKFIISLLSIIICIIYLVLHKLTVKDKLIDIGIFSCYGVKLKEIKTHIFFENWIINVISIIAGFLIYCFVIKVIFNNQFVIKNMFTARLNINFNTLYIFFVLSILISGFSTILIGKDLNKYQVLELLNKGRI